MKEEFWRAKIWGLLHDPVLKALHTNTSGRGENSFWQSLGVMTDWVNNGWDPEESSGTILKRIKLSDQIASASDRGAISNLSGSVNYGDRGLEIRHLLSGEKLILKLGDREHQQTTRNRVKYLAEQEQNLCQQVPQTLKSDPKQLFWWLWRCLPVAVCKQFNDPSLLLMPAETRLPDCSIWSHTSLTAALAGALVGYDLTQDEIKRKPKDYILSHPYLVSFTFSPIQELIKASRKMRDFWAGSWILHYLSARVCWQLANQYGPDCFIYPSLFEQPLIDYWLLQQAKRLDRSKEFESWIEAPRSSSLLTAGFPNVLVLILPKDRVAPAMQFARETLLNEWRNISHLVFEELQKHSHSMPQLQEDHKTWRGWLDAQWQTYWSAVSIGKYGEELKSSGLPTSNLEKEKEIAAWIEAQNQAYGFKEDRCEMIDLEESRKLFQKAEWEFLSQAGNRRLESQKRQFSLNVGSWWPHIFDQTRLSLTCIKNARDWRLPTAFGPRSTISGLGSIIHPDNLGKYEDWVKEGEISKFWKWHPGFFNKTEKLNATEAVKRGLQKILPELFDLEKDSLSASYPDLTAGVAGYLKSLKSLENSPQGEQALHHFHEACKAVQTTLTKEQRRILDADKQLPDADRQHWGIPWVDEYAEPIYGRYHPRLLSAGWLAEELGEPDDTGETIAKCRDRLQEVINGFYSKNNPTDWYVLAAGDGDDMSEWLKGTKMLPYRNYVASSLNVSQEEKEAFEKFVDLTKRMGPSSHSSLSRALLDFSNKLVPYLTEYRYAGRLIYSGGDDVLAYTNLWEWDRWLWDVRQCFRGEPDPKKDKKEFCNEGNYWRWNSEELPTDGDGDFLLPNRPLFTMGKEATISFGVVIAHHSVPLAIALETLWAAEEGAKEHQYASHCSLKHQKEQYTKKDAVQVCIIYGSGNLLKATCKFDVFHQWQNLLSIPNLNNSIFEQAAILWEQHPAPSREAIVPWLNIFCDRREQLNESNIESFRDAMNSFLEAIWTTTKLAENEYDHPLWVVEKREAEMRDREICRWLKLAAFVLRNREIKI